MSERDRLPEIMEIIRLAMMATPAMEDASEWRRAVGDRIPEVARALDPMGSLAKRAERMLEGRWLKGVIKKVSYEERSTRGYIEFEATVGKPKKPGEETEHFRTERTDDPDSGGKELFDAIQDWVGWECEFWLYTEAISADQKVRVVQWFNPLRRADEVPASPAQTSGYRPNNPGLGTPIIDKITADYGGQVAVRYVQRLRADLGIGDAHNPPEHRLEECRETARTIVREEQERREQ